TSRDASSLSSTWGMPQTPKPPTARVAPSSIWATASAASVNFPVLVLISVPSRHGASSEKYPPENVNYSTSSVTNPSMRRRRKPPHVQNNNGQDEKLCPRTK